MMIHGISQDMDISRVSLPGMLVQIKHGNGWTSNVGDE